MTAINHDPPIRRTVREAATDAAAGDQSAWQELVQAYHGWLLSIARAHDLNGAEADDAVQATWAALFTHIGSLRSLDALGAWLATTTRRQSLRILRQRNREVCSAEPIAPPRVAATYGVGWRRSDHIDPSEIVMARLDGEHRRTCLTLAAQTLPRQQAALVNLLLAEDASQFSYRQIADHLGIPIGSIGPVRRRALNNLRVSLDHDL